MTSKEKTKSTSILFGFKIGKDLLLRNSKISFIEFELPTSFSLFSPNNFIADNPLASSEHPCFFGTGSKIETSAAKCYVIYGDTSPSHEYNKRPAKIRVERITKDAVISANTNMYLSIEDLVLPNVETIHMKATLYLRNSANQLVKFSMEIYELVDLITAAASVN